MAEFAVQLRAAGEIPAPSRTKCQPVLTPCCAPQMAILAALAGSNLASCEVSGGQKPGSRAVAIVPWVHISSMPDQPRNHIQAVKPRPQR